MASNTTMKRGRRPRRRPLCYRRYDFPQLLWSEPLLSFFFFSTPTPIIRRIGTTSRNECKAKDSTFFFLLLNPGKRRKIGLAPEGCVKTLLLQDSLGFFLIFYGEVCVCMCGSIRVISFIYWIKKKVLGNIFKKDNHY